MLSKKLKWYFLAESKAEFEAFFENRATAIRKTMVGEVLLVKENEQFFAFKNQCPHQRKPLNDCVIQNEHIVCPFHKYHFALQDGRGHGLYIDKYPLDFRDDGSIWIGKEQWRLF